MSKRTAYPRLVGIALLAAGLAACSQDEQAATTQPQIVERVLTLTPASAPVKGSVLAGTLEEMKVTERVERESGKAVDPPKLRATLKLKNASETQAVRPVTGTLAFLDAAGRAIPLADGRVETSFNFYGYQERLDPGMETTQMIEVPFPAPALQETKLHEIRLELAYIPSPFKAETISIPVSMTQ